MTTSILWFRRDLRLHDNPALNWVIDNSEHIVAVYIDDAEPDNAWKAGAASKWWLHHSLSSLQSSLQQHGQTLHLFAGNTLATLTDIIQQTRAEHLVFNHLYEPYYRQQASLLHQKLDQQIEFVGFDSGLFFKPGSVLNNQQKPYRVYTPFYKKLRPLLDEYYSHYRINKPSFKSKKNIKLKSSVSLNQLELIDSISWHSEFGNIWQPGEDAAHHALESFLDEAVYYYQSQRDIPAVEGTSRLSPALHFGEITPQQIFLSLQPLLYSNLNAEQKNAIETYIKQLIWREFAQHILWHFPHTAESPMDTRYENSFWKKDPYLLKKWQQGKTGMPIVDAGMQQLWKTGWMHNRVRMISSSFLTKNLGISWLEGARWFWDTLLDANLANNSMGWQWVAGCGVDAAPYYRIFNPLTQSQRFDSKQHYAKQWLETGDAATEAEPVISLSDSRKQALDRYKQYIQNS